MVSKHFHDARYYLGRAGEHAKLGVREELAPVTERVSGLTERSESDDDEESRWEEIRREIGEVETKAASAFERAVGPRDPSA